MYELKKEKTAELINTIKGQAKFFLDRASEFYPFGYIVDTAGTIKPLEIMGNENFPNSGDVLIQLEEIIKSGINAGSYLCGSIGLDVYVTIKTNDTEKKKEALEIRYYQGEECYINRFQYEKINGEYVFQS